jgi:hypothetical protein
LLSRLNEGAEDIVHEGLVAFAVRPEPLQDVMVHSNIDMVFAGWDANNRLRPVRLRMNWL